MKSIVLLLLAAFLTGINFAQSYSSVAEIVTVHSQNGQYYLRSTPYDNESPSLRGFTEVFAKDSPAPLYTIPRGFDSVDEDGNNLVLSNDGNTVFYLIPWGEDEDKEGLKTVSIYRRGSLVRSYSASEITGCDLSKERCSIEYNNYQEVVDKERSAFGTASYKKVFKAGVSEQERFLSDYVIFTSDDTVYLTDSKKNLHRFSLSEAKYLNSQPFLDAYEGIKSKGRFNAVELKRFDVPVLGEFPPLSSGGNSIKALGTTLKMVPYNIFGTADEKFKKYGFTVSGYLFKDGSFQVTEIDNFNDLPKEHIEGFFKANKFATRSIPYLLDRWFIKEEYFLFRKADTKIAIKERQAEIIKERAELQKRLIAESVNGRYIPRDLGDCFVELDKELPEITRNEMKALATRQDMIQYHMGLGLWMRNNWGLWGGSRLQKYFSVQGVSHPDEMSSVILFFYWDWLRGNKEKWKDWEQNPKQKLV